MCKMIGWRCVLCDGLIVGGWLSRARAGFASLCKIQGLWFENVVDVCLADFVRSQQMRLFDGSCCGCLTVVAMCVWYEMEDGEAERRK